MVPKIRLVFKAAVYKVKSDEDFYHIKSCFWEKR